MDEYVNLKITLLGTSELYQIFKVAYNLHHYKKSISGAKVMKVDLNKTKRLGIHYFPDTYHYRESDIHRWLPELKDLGMNWITLLALPNRAIPEFFIRSLVEENIEPVILIQSPIHSNFDPSELELLLSMYAKWGVRYISPFDRPNLRRMWHGWDWTSNGIVERFLDIYLPIATHMVDLELVPVLPPLEPGGDYWDTAFIRMFLRGIKRRGDKKLLEMLTIGAYGWKYNRPLDWGIGGPEKWPESQPYFTPADSQDQIGFRIFDWYSTIIQAELDRECPIIVLAGGENKRLNFHNNPSAQAQTLIAITEMLIEKQNTIPTNGSKPVPNNLTAFNFWLLSASQESPDLQSAWIKPDGTALPIVSFFRKLRRQYQNKPEIKEYIPPIARKDSNSKVSQGSPSTKPIEHYLLLPIYSWGPADLDFNGIGPFVQRFQPTVGFSIDEAKHSKRVTIAGRISTIPAEHLDQLRSAGCKLESLDEDGTLLAIK